MNGREITNLQQLHESTKIDYRPFQCAKCDLKALNSDGSHRKDMKCIPTKRWIKAQQPRKRSKIWKWKHE